MRVNDYILDGRGYGDFGAVVGERGFRPELYQPFIDHAGQKCAMMHTGRMIHNKKLDKIVPERKKMRVSDLVANGVTSPVFNATTLRKEEWIELDRVIVRAARYRLRAWSDLAAANSIGGFNGFAKMEYEYETMSDPGEAIVDMDGITDGRDDSPRYQLQGIPLPITQSGFYFSERRLAISRNTGTPLDTTMGEAAGRRVAEMVEKTLLGVLTGITYGPGIGTPSLGRTSQVYGYTNFPSRLTYNPTSTAPTAAGWTAAKTVADVLAMRQKLYNNKFFGPFMLYHSNDWDTYLDNDYILTGGNVATQTLRDRLRKIDDIQDVRRLDFLFSAAPTGQVQTYNSLFPFTMIMVQMTKEVAAAINGMDITTIQWPEKGGQQLNFKVFCIQVPLLRADFYNNCGILHATMTN